MTRPTSVTIICWYLLISSIISLVSLALTFNDPQIARVMEQNALPVSFQYLLFAAGVLVAIAAGLLMLDGKNLGRVLYVSWTAFSIAVSFIASPMKMLMLPGIVVFMLIAFFLYRPAASAYFGSEGEEEVAADDS